MRELPGPALVVLPHGLGPAGVHPRRPAHDPHRRARRAHLEEAFDLIEELEYLWRNAAPVVVTDLPACDLCGFPAATTPTSPTPRTVSADACPACLKAGAPGAHVLGTGHTVYLMTPSEVRPGCAPTPTPGGPRWVWSESGDHLGRLSVRQRQVANPLRGRPMELAVWSALVATPSVRHRPRVHCVRIRVATAAHARRVRTGGTGEER